MKRILFSILCLLIGSTTMAQNDLSIAEEKLCAIHSEDQTLRERMSEAINQWDVEKIISYQQQIDDSDLRHQAFIATFISQYRIIPEGLSKRAYSAIFLTIDHADLKFQKRYFKSLQEAAQRGLIPQSDVATLQDRILMYSGKPQIYGTQTKASNIKEGEDKITYVWPIKDPHNVDSLRATVGLCTMQEQSEAHRKYGFTVIWDTSLSIAEVKRLTAAKAN